jgi:hypothetical protein
MAKKGKHFGIWLDEQKALELDEKIEASGKCGSQYLKDQLEKAEALNELYAFMVEMMRPTKKPSEQDMKFLQKIEGMLD